MSNTIYRLNIDGTTTPMKRKRCKDESKELQEVLEKNFNLLPGDQIDPTDPRRWLLVKREMPVPDPVSGQNRWSIDFVFLDQSAIPTFVECKRFDDTRSRREVVGQMLEYAANGQFFWTGEDFMQIINERIEGTGKTIENVLQDIGPDDDMDADEFFERAENNLREGQIRLVFFLEEAPIELKSIVDFLNKQMERTEVLLVEAKQYELDGTIVIVPFLFGYTEEARQIKRSVVVSSRNQSRRKWNEMTFFNEIKNELNDDEVDAITKVFNYARPKFKIKWGSGRTTGSFNVSEPEICPRSFLTVWTNGRMFLNFHWLNGSESAEKFRRVLQTTIRERFEWEVPDGEVEYRLNSSEWIHFVDELIAVIDDVVRKILEEAPS